MIILLLKGLDVYYNDQEQYVLFAISDYVSQNPNSWFKIPLPKQCFPQPYLPFSLFGSRLEHRNAGGTFRQNPTHRPNRTVMHTNDFCRREGQSVIHVHRSAHRSTMRALWGALWFGKWRVVVSLLIHTAPQSPFAPFLSGMDWLRVALRTYISDGCTSFSITESRRCSAVGAGLSWAMARSIVNSL